jgi:hypothetical protein
MGAGRAVADRRDRRDERRAASQVGDHDPEFSGRSHKGDELSIRGAAVLYWKARAGADTNTDAGHGTLARLDADDRRCPSVSLGQPMWCRLCR